MKITTLACDYCMAVVAAVAGRRLLTEERYQALRRGKGLKTEDPSLDLCKLHAHAIDQSFNRAARFPSGKRRGRLSAVDHKLAAIEEKRERDRVRSATKRAGGHPKGEVAPWAAREATVLSLLPAHGTVSTVALWEQVTRLAKEKTMPPGAYKKVMQRLRDRGFVKQHGSRSRTKYERANGKG